MASAAPITEPANLLTREAALAQMKESIAALSISEADKNKIRGENAARILALAPVLSGRKPDYS